MSVWGLIRTGGWTMVPLFLCSVAVWGIVVERLWALRGWREKNREFLLSFSNLWLRSDRENARKLCSQSDVELARIAEELLREAPNMVGRVERRRLEEAADLRRFLWLLGTIGTASPFIGLFGTVVGIIRAFTSMAETGAGGFTVVAAGISEALVATAAGILVAVIAVFFYNYFQVRVGRLQFQLKLFSEEMVELIDQKGAA